jgi:hypothetical protein
MSTNALPVVQSAWPLAHSCIWSCASECAAAAEAGRARVRVELDQIYTDDRHTVNVPGLVSRQY